MQSVSCVYYVLIDFIGKTGGVVFWLDVHSAECLFCEMCFERGIIVPTEEIYHDLLLSEGGTHDRSNLIALCKSYHSREHVERGDRWHSR